jgi:hypothetical protein
VLFLGRAHILVVRNVSELSGALFTKQLLTVGE